MTFTPNASGGSYSHSHIYGIKVNEYYGSNANIRVRKSDGSWQDGQKDGAEHAIFNNSNQAGDKNLNTMTYKIESNTSYSNDMHPYITVFFWRRTA